MTGPEHYHEAERLRTEIDPQWQADYITANTRKARVHAILALAAPTALHGVTDHQHWFEVAGAGHAHG